MAGYTKLFSSIITSTIWCEDDPTRIVWITMVALAGPDGLVDATLPGLANVSRISIEKTRAAIEKFLSPDPDSRDSDFEGRRIERVGGIFRLLNYEKYRFKSSLEHKREVDAERQRRWRSGHREKTPVTHLSRMSRQGEGEAEAEETSTLEAVVSGTVESVCENRTQAPDTDKKNGESTVVGSPLVKPRQTHRNAPGYDSVSWTTFWNAYPRKNAKQAAFRAFQKLCPNAELLETMLKALEKQKHQESWMKDGGSFIPHPATWLNGKRWDDEIQPGGGYERSQSGSRGGHRSEGDGHAGERNERRDALRSLSQDV